MRELNANEINATQGGSTGEFNQCMGDNWAHNTVVAGVSGAFVGGFVGGVLGLMGGSTGTAIYCGGVAIF